MNFSVSGNVSSEKKTQICIAKYKVIVSSNKSYIHHHTLDTGDCDLKNVNVIFYLVVQLALCNSYIIHTWHYVIHLIVKIKIPNIRSSLRSITCFLKRIIKTERCSLILQTLHLKFFQNLHTHNKIVEATGLLSRPFRNCSSSGL